MATATASASAESAMVGRGHPGPFRSVRNPRDPLRADDPPAVSCWGPLGHLLRHPAIPVSAPLGEGVKEPRTSGALRQSRPLVLGGAGLGVPRVPPLAQLAAASVGGEAEQEHAVELHLLVRGDA